MRFLSVDDFISFLSMEDSLIMAIAAEGGNKLSMVLRFSASLQAFSKLYDLSAETKKRKVKWAPCWTAVYVHVDLSKICANLGLNYNDHNFAQASELVPGFSLYWILIKAKTLFLLLFLFFFFHSSCGSATIKTWQFLAKLLIINKGKYTNIYLYMFFKSANRLG